MELGARQHPDLGIETSAEAIGCGTCGTRAVSDDRAARRVRYLDNLGTPDSVGVRQSVVGACLEPDCRSQEDLRLFALKRGGVL
jgi:hypothetical protein